MDSQTDSQPDPQHDPERFGFGWFAAVLMSHRTLWRDVLVASLVLQLIGLATPLFTQVIVDKVVVHHTVSTLVAMTAGLALFAVFSALLGWTRQALVLHIGNQVDARLGAAVF
ncbi:MAG: transporter, partial [Rhizobacter sp.]|nr:transporter [Rhizobacter sp.]